MIEIINCIYLTIFFLILFRLNFLDKILRKFLERKDISLVEIYSINILIVFIFLLFISFFNLNYLTVILILFSLNLLSLFINIKTDINNILLKFIFFKLFFKIQDIK